MLFQCKLRLVRQGSLHPLYTFLSPASLWLLYFSSTVTFFDFFSSRFSSVFVYVLVRLFYSLRLPLTLTHYIFLFNATTFLSLFELVPHSCLVHLFLTILSILILQSVPSTIHFSFKISRLSCLNSTGTTITFTWQSSEHRSADNGTDSGPTDHFSLSIHVELLNDSNVLCTIKMK